MVERTLAYPYKVWGYGESIGLEALLSVTEASGEPSGYEFVRDLMEQWCAERPTIAETDHVAPGVALLEVYRRTGEPHLLAQARRLADHFAGLPRTASGATLHRVGHPEFSQYVYVDCLYTDAPFLCSLARITGDPGYYQQAIDLFEGHARLLQDERTGLFYHLYDAGREQTNGAFWGRGNGWAILGLINTLALLEPGDPRRHALHARLARLAYAVAALQAPDGHWHTVLDKPETYKETSLAAFFCLAFNRGVALSLLPASYLKTAQKAWLALAGCIDDTGLVTGVSQATPPGDAAHYGRVPAGGLYPWGQGPALLSALIHAYSYPAEKISFQRTLSQ